MSAPEGAVWSATLDDVWDVYVMRLPSGQGLLTVAAIHPSGDVLVSRQVTFAHEPRFGPDVEDVDDWMTIAEAAVDAREKDA